MEGTESKRQMMVYTMSADVACLFYELCKDYALDTEQERVSLLNFLARQGLMNSVSTTQRTKQQIVADWQKHFDVLDLTGDGNELAS